MRIAIDGTVYNTAQQMGNRPWRARITLAAGAILTFNARAKITQVFQTSPSGRMASRPGRTISPDTVKRGNAPLGHSQ